MRMATEDRIEARREQAEVGLAVAEALPEPPRGGLILKSKLAQRCEYVTNKWETCSVPATVGFGGFRSESEVLREVR